MAQNHNERINMYAYEAVRVFLELITYIAYLVRRLSAARCPCRFPGAIVRLARAHRLPSKLIAFVRPRGWSPLPALSHCRCSCQVRLECREKRQHPSGPTE